MSLTREEIMNLSKLTEDEQIEYLHNNGIMKAIQCEQCGWWNGETLSDCADRLWREAANSVPREEFKKAMRDVFRNERPGGACYDDLLTGWFLFSADGIHRIRAALLAMEGK